MGDVYKANFPKAGCKSCAPPPPPWGAWIFVMVLAATIGAVAASQLVAARGTQVVRSECGWDPDTNEYRARFTLNNRENRYKLVEVSVQGRFKPQPGARWPSDSLKFRYEAVTHSTALLIDPSSEAIGEERFSVPGAPDLLCSARITVSRQERFDERPPADLIKMATP